MKKITKIKILCISDSYPDLSFLGHYTDKWEDGAIERVNVGHREFKYFIPGNHVPHDPKTWNHVDEITRQKDIAQYGSLQLADETYARQDYERMEAYNRGDWWMVGIKAEAVVHTSQNGNDWLINRVSSGGLWGIESDSEESYFGDVAKEELSVLKTTLIELGFTTKEIETAFQTVEYPN